MEMNQILLTMSQETLANIRKMFEWSRVKSQNCSNKEARNPRLCAQFQNGCQAECSSSGACPSLVQLQTSQASVYQGEIP